MTISIVTGGAGFIGSHIVEKLKKLDHMVVVIDNEYSDNDNFHWRKDTLNVNIDITDYKALKKAFTGCLLYTSPSPRDGLLSRMPSSA